MITKAPGLVSGMGYVATPKINKAVFCIINEGSATRLKLTIIGIVHYDISSGR